MVTSDVWVEVNEARLIASNQGAAWWWSFLYPKPYRPIVMHKVSLGGCIVRVQCDDLNDANDLRGLLIDNGVPQSACRVVTERTDPR